MGAYQVLGNVFVNLPGHAGAAGYRRDLDLVTALSHVSYAANGGKFQREFLCSHPAEVLAAQFTAEKPAAYTGSLELADTHGAKITVTGNRITAAGTLSNGMKFEWQLQVLNQGGSVAPGTGTNATRLEFKNCDGLTLLIAAGTDYVFDSTKNFHGDAPHARVTQQIDSAAKKTFAELKAKQMADYQSLFNRVTRACGASP